MGNKSRKMPHTDDAKTNGKIDIGKYSASQPAVRDALASGETRFHEINVRFDKSGVPTMKIKRSHDGKGGADPKLAVALNDFLQGLIAQGLVKLADMSEGPVEANHDEFVVQGG